jgi:G:T-mismatch repair DNA endonuclease (very short patch repair protein)
MIEKNIYIQHGGNEGEKILIRDNKKKYKVDGYCKQNNTIYEFHGDIWHGNPKIYDKDSLNPFNNKRFGDLYEETLEKEKFIKEKGFNLITIWECDYRNK